VRQTIMTMTTSCTPGGALGDRAHAGARTRGSVDGCRPKGRSTMRSLLLRTRDGSGSTGESQQGRGRRRRGNAATACADASVLSKGL
jgi:hypothetical protein